MARSFMARSFMARSFMARSFMARSFMARSFMAHGFMAHGFASALLPAALFLVLSGGSVAAQTRTFACPKHGPITVTVTGPNSVSAGPIEGKTLRLNKNPQDPLHFLWGDYGIKVAPNQAEITLEIPDWGTEKCIYGARSAAPRPSAPPPRQPVATRDPCGPGYRQAPETDRCDPIPGAAGKRAREAALAGDFPVEAQSLGGIVRALPAQSAARVASLAEGTPVVIMARAEEMDGYSWFKIGFQGRVGYQWGGIMCSRNPLNGILKQCDQP
jgi:hypothetical protein